jgi:hypothetical protein
VLVGLDVDGSTGNVTITLKAPAGVCGKGGGVKRPDAGPHRCGGRLAPGDLAPVVDHVAKPVVTGLNARFLVDFDPVTDANCVTGRKQQRGNTFRRHAEDLSVDGLTGFPDLDFVAHPRQLADSSEL